MALLTEYTNNTNAKLLIEHQTDDNTGGKNLYMKGIFVQGDIRNQNGRIYPVSEIRRAVDSMNKVLMNGSIAGELDHPTELNINLDRVSHMITEMWMDGPNGYGKLQIVPTPMGNIARTLIESGFRMGVSSRGSGEVNDNGYVSDFEIVTVDLVANPSAKDALPVPLWESLNAKRGYIIEDLAKSVSHDETAQKFLKEELINFIKSLN